MAQYYVNTGFQAKAYQALDRLNDNAYIAIHTGTALSGQAMLDLLTPAGGCLGSIAISELLSVKTHSRDDAFHRAFTFSEIHTSPNSLVIHANSDINAAARFANALYEALLADPDRFAGCMVRVGCGGAVLFTSPSIAPSAPAFYNDATVEVATPQAPKSKPLKSLELRDSLKRRGIPLTLANLVMYVPVLMLEQLNRKYGSVRWVSGFHLTSKEDKLTLSSPEADIIIDANDGVTVTYLNDNPDMGVIEKMLSVIAEPFE